MFRILTYALQFHRPPKASGGAERLTTAPGLRATTSLEGGLISSRFDPLPGGLASYEAPYVLNHDGTLFFEWGVIRFGAEPGASELTFSSVGAGRLLRPPGADGLSHGVVVWKIDSGTGALAGAAGAITSNFLINLETDELVDSHLGVVRLPDAQGGTQ
jgi:hypothetical protein